MQLLLSGMVQTGETSPAWCITPVCNNKELNPSSFAIVKFPLWIAGKIKRKGEKMPACSRYCYIWCLQSCPKYSFQNVFCAMHVHHQWVFLSISCEVPCLTRGLFNPWLLQSTKVDKKKNKNKSNSINLNSTVALVDIAQRKNWSECAAQFKPAVRESSEIILRYNCCQIKRKSKRSFGMADRENDSSGTLEHLWSTLQLHHLQCSAQATSNIHTW